MLPRLLLGVLLPGISSSYTATPIRRAAMHKEDGPWEAIESQANRSLNDVRRRRFWKVLSLPRGRIALLFSPRPLHQGWDCQIAPRQDRAYLHVVLSFVSSFRRYSARHVTMYPVYHVIFVYHVHFKPHDIAITFHQQELANAPRLRRVMFTDSPGSSRFSPRIFS